MFKGMGGLGNLTSMFGAMQQMPERLKELNARMKSETVSASSGCGKITVTMNGTGHVKQVSIEGDLDRHELEVAIEEATNAAGAAAKELYAESISQLVSELNLNVPGLDGMLASLTGSR